MRSAKREAENKTTNASLKNSHQPAIVKHRKASEWLRIWVGETGIDASEDKSFKKFSNK